MFCYTRILYIKAKTFNNKKLILKELKKFIILTVYQIIHIQNSNQKLMYLSFMI